MTHGMSIYGAGGGLTYSSTDVTWNQVDMLFCPRGQTTTNDYPALRGREVLVGQMMINPPPVDRRAVAHTITVSGTLVTVQGGTEDTYVVVLMR